MLDVSYWYVWQHVFFLCRTADRITRTPSVCGIDNVHLYQQY